jgi:hypothetical protein
VGGLRQQAQCRKSYKESLRGGACGQAERGAERVALRTWEVLEPGEHRRAELVERGEGQLHLGLDAHGAGDPEPGRRSDRVIHERGLADSRLASQHQNPAPTGACSHEQPVEHVALVATAHKHRSAPA